MRRYDRHVRIWAAAAALALALLAPSAASAAKSPSQLLAASVAAAKSASSVHIVAAGIPDGAQSISLDLRLTAGKGGGGRMTIGSDAVDIVVLRPFVYFKAGAKFWKKYGRSSAAVVQLLADRWVKMSASNPNFAPLVGLTDISAFIDNLASEHGKLTAGGTKTISGKAAVGIRDTAKSGGGTLWVAASGAPFPLELTQAGGAGYVDFEDWNASVHVKAPASSVDFSHVKG